MSRHGLDGAFQQSSLLQFRKSGHREKPLGVATMTQAGPGHPAPAPPARLRSCPPRNVPLFAVHRAPFLGTDWPHAPM